MSERDDYIKSERTERKLGLPGVGATDGDRLTVSQEEAFEAGARLERLDWTHGLSRDDLRRQYLELPLGIYLRLPDSKRYRSAAEVLHEAGIARSRSEGDFLGANPNIPDAKDDGGPPAWGGISGVFPQRMSNESGSATDTEGLLPGEPTNGESADGS